MFEDRIDFVILHPFHLHVPIRGPMLDVLCGLSVCSDNRSQMPAAEGRKADDVHRNGSIEVENEAYRCTG